MITKLEELQSRVTFWIYWIAIVVTVVVVSFIGLMLYWMVEPDPLTVNYAPGFTQWSVCQDRKYRLVRDVQSTKDLTIHIKEYWWDIDGMMDVNGKMNEYPHKPITTYTLSAGTDRIFDFPKTVPADLPEGRYRYRPHAEYRINPIKVIHRDLPVQFVQVKCSYDKEKHCVME